jgi:cystathionine beta-lyase/cystathionine gamma-synthase
MWWASAVARRERADDSALFARLRASVEERIAALGATAAPAPTARDRLRRRLVLAAALAMADSVQSPVITGPGTWDYRRDRHRDGAEWEHAWLSEILAGQGRGRRALLTSCGMAAITTVLAFIERHTGSGTIVVDDNVYHETRHLVLTGALRDRVCVVASNELAERAARDDVAVVIVDAVSNTRDVRIADLHALLSRSHAREGPLVVVDTSVCSMSAPMVRDVWRPGRSRLMLVESLTKHAQLGLDRVTAGVIVADDADATRLDGLREHLGTNIADIACLLLPRPDRAALEHRLRRLDRNAALVATALAAAGHDVCHPSLAAHPDHPRWKRFRPSCGIVTLPVDAPVDGWLAAARAAAVALDHGAGFGFDVTRVYRTARTVPEASAFVRVAPGTESLDVIRRVAALLSAPRLP